MIVDATLAPEEAACSRCAAALAPLALCFAVPTEDDTVDEHAASLLCRKCLHGAVYEEQEQPPTSVRIP